ncbi:hypothetical protein PR048_024157 [Dryococelus australis]|uniref:Uncharacterized protein n=1 Tax=Dryococelus australis TaxID=614101 RepID=A0ABQ9GW63_9NEOP|nr:hypothetical protein PR048_024157 [Dryococelus australis]
MQVLNEPAPHLNALESSGGSFIMAMYGEERCETLNKHRYYTFNTTITRQHIRFGCSFTHHRFCMLAFTTNIPLLHKHCCIITSCSTSLAASLPAAPQALLNLISCNCKKGCSRGCDCLPSSLLCSEMCSRCAGVDCNNTPAVRKTKMKSVKSNYSTPTRNVSSIAGVLISTSGNAIPWLWPRGRSGVVATRYSHVGIVSEDAACRRSFSGISPPPPVHAFRRSPILTLALNVSIHRTSAVWKTRLVVAGVLVLPDTAAESAAQPGTAGSPSSFLVSQSCSDSLISRSKEPSAQRGPWAEVSLSHACSHIMRQEQLRGLPSMSSTATLLRSRSNVGSLITLILLLRRLSTRSRGISLNGRPWMLQMLLLSICGHTMSLSLLTNNSYRLVGDSSTYMPTYHGAVGWYATYLGCGRFWVSVLGKALVRRQRRRRNTLSSTSHSMPARLSPATCDTWLWLMSSTSSERSVCRPALSRPGSRLLLRLSSSNCGTAANASSATRAMRLSCSSALRSSGRRAKAAGGNSGRSATAPLDNASSSLLRRSSSVRRGIWLKPRSGRVRSWLCASRSSVSDDKPASVSASTLRTALWLRSSSCSAARPRSAPGSVSSRLCDASSSISSLK